MRDAHAPPHMNASTGSELRVTFSRMARKPKTKEPHPGGRPIEMEGPWGAMATAAGGVNKLAEMLGVTTMTVWRWSQGGKMQGPARIVVESTAERLGVRSPL